MTKNTVESQINSRGVATVWLNRPEVNNAYNGELIGELSKTFKELEQNSGVRVVLLRGRGRHFQAGADLSWINEVRSSNWQRNFSVSLNTTEAVMGIMTCSKPTIALIHGACVGGGTGLASACDVIVAETSAKFAISEAKWGLIATPIIPQLISRIGPARLRRYALTCETFDAEQALAIGLVDEVAEPQNLETTVKPIIDSILHCPPQALSETKKSILKFSNLYFSELEREEMAVPHAAKRMSDEAKEGLKSFHDKRKPSWYTGE